MSKPQSDEEMIRALTTWEDEAPDPGAVPDAILDERWEEMRNEMAGFIAAYGLPALLRCVADATATDE